MKKMLWIGQAMLLALAITPSHAGRIYGGVSVGQSDFEVEGAGVRFKPEDTGYKALAGYRFLRFVAVELAYTDLGHFDEVVSDARLEADARAISAFAVGILPVTPRLDLFAKLGAAAWDSDVTVTDGGGADRTDDNGIDSVYGVGLGYRFTDLVGMRLEWEEYDFDTADTVRFGSIGVHLRF